MDPRSNPYSPGAGAPPPELAGRERVLAQADVTLHRLKNRLSARSQILVGLRGVGKTVLLNRIQAKAKDQSYQTVFVEAHEGKSLAEMLAPRLRQTLFSLSSGEKVNRGLRVLKSFLGSLRAKASFGDLELEMGVQAERGVADSGDLEIDLSEMLVAIGEAAAERNEAIGLFIDELQYLKVQELSALIMAMHQISQKALPILLVGAGLPQILMLVGKSKSYAERLFEYPSIDALSFGDACDALQQPALERGASFSDGALASIATLTKGYPYFLQQWGSEAWNIAEGPEILEDDVTAATVQAIRHLDESFFRVRFDRLTPREKDYLFALAKLGPGHQRSGDIAERFGITVQTAAPLRTGLIHKGMIYSPSHGDTAFSVPLFGDFLLRTMETQ